MTSETFQFQAEINQLLSLIINTFYSNKDIFLRELISNASDAIDKAKYNKNGDDHSNIVKEYSIKVSSDKVENTITIEDNGIGMTKDELISCLGTIANSGTKQFMESMLSDATGSDQKNNMIGQFGVGFYSAYLVADTVKVYSKHANTTDDNIVYCWESKAGGSFTITELDDVDMSQGTRLVLSMKEDCKEYLEESTLKRIVQTHSQYIVYPIMLLTTKSITKEVPVEEESSETEKENENEDEEGKIEDVTEEEDKPPTTKTVTEEVEEYVHVNNQKPIWTNKPGDVTHEEYAAFYKSLTNDWGDHLAVKHFSVEGQLEFKSILFVPKQAPFDLFTSGKKKNNLKLFVKRVFIMDKCDELIPDWLSFVSGIVDSEDLPLNVSREMLQQNKVMKIIKKNLVKKCIELFTDLSEEKDKYKAFFDEFNQSMKLGIIEDSTNRDKLVNLLRFQSLDHEEYISFDEYVDHMKEDQKDIYFLTGESRKALLSSPFVKGIQQKGHDVLFMTHPIDEHMLQHVKTYQEKTLVNVSKEHDSFKETNTEYETHLCKRMKEVLSESVDKVVVSTRLSDDPCCIVSSTYGWSANMERIMKSQTLQTNKNPMAMMHGGKRSMEINPNHAIIARLQDAIKENNMSDTFINDSIRLLYDTSMLSSGYTHEDPSRFTSRIYSMLSVGMGTPSEVEDTTEPEVEDTTEPMEDNMEEVD